MQRHFKTLCAALLVCAAGASFAHVVLQDTSAPTNTSYRAVLRVGHGCDGAPTTAMKVLLPAGFNGAQPMPKAGWSLSTVRGKLAVPYESHGKTYTEGVQEITWTANGAENALPAAYYDEFVLRGTTPAKAGTIWFKVVQSCDKGQNAWVEVPASGTSTKGLKFPAARLDVGDVKPETVHHAH
jgi:periplasmic copper chaperone A